MEFLRVLQTTTVSTVTAAVDETVFGATLLLFSFLNYLTELKFVTGNVLRVAVKRACSIKNCYLCWFVKRGINGG